MIIKNLEDVTILDGNGDPFNERKSYFNRYQSTIPHTLTLNGLFVKHIKTVGGFISDRPAVHIRVTYPNYAGGKTRRHDSHFEAEYIKEGVYGFHQLIPVDVGIKLDFEYGDNRSYVGAVLKKLAKDSAMEGKPENVRETLEYILDVIKELRGQNPKVVDSVRSAICDIENWANYALSLPPHKGRWENGTTYEYEYAYCSECGHMQWAGWDSHRDAEDNIEEFAHNYKFCPSCGAKMEGFVYVK